MSDFRIVFTRPEDGGVSVIIPAPGVTRDEAVKAVPAGLSYDIVARANIPADRTFRSAWELSGSTVVQNLTKSKAIAHERRRAAREAEFAPLDIQATIPAKASQVESDRQAIRDKYDALQIAIDAATTVEQLKAAAAAVLGRLA